MMSGYVEQRREQGIRRGTLLNERPNKDLKTNHRRIELNIQLYGHCKY